MATQRTCTRGIWSVLAVLLLLGVIALRAGPGGAEGGGFLDPGLCAPEGNTFTADAIDNPFFPLPVGAQWVLTGVDAGESIGLQITVTPATETLYGSTANPVVTRVVEELEWADANGDGVVDTDEIPIEISRNYFAQAADGTVCYFGEAVDIYDENGVVVAHDGAWRADEPGHAPGIFMPVDPAPGMKFVQEVAPGIAEDEAAIVGGKTATVPAGTFTDTLRVRETNPLDGGKGTKTYAAGVGLLVDGPVRLVSSTLLSVAGAPVAPEPQAPAAAGDPEDDETGDEAEDVADDEDAGQADDDEGEEENGRSAGRDEARAAGRKAADDAGDRNGGSERRGGAASR